VFEFVEEAEQAIKEVQRVLKSGGWFIGGFLNSQSELGKHKENDSIIRHGTLYSRGQLESMFSVLGKPVIREGVHLSLI